MQSGRKEIIMKEYIFEFGDALYNEETGEAVFNPKVKGELIRCKDCKYWNGEGKYCDYDMSGLREDFCSWAERKEADS